MAIRFIIPKCRVSGPASFKVLRASPRRCNRPQQWLLPHQGFLSAQNRRGIVAWAMYLRCQNAKS